MSTKTKTTIKEATNRAILMLQEAAIMGAVIDTRSEGCTLTVRRSFTVEGHIIVRYELRYEPGKKTRDALTCVPHVETSFPSGIKSGIEMASFGLLVRELTDAALCVQLMLDQLEIGGDS